MSSESDSRVTGLQTWYKTFTPTGVEFDRIHKKPKHILDKYNDTKGIFILPHDREAYGEAMDMLLRLKGNDGKWLKSFCGDTEINDAFSDINIEDGIYVSIGSTSTQAWTYDKIRDNSYNAQIIIPPERDGAYRELEKCNDDLRWQRSGALAGLECLGENAYNIGIILNDAAKKKGDKAKIFFFNSIGYSVNDSDCKVQSRRFTGDEIITTWKTEYNNDDKWIHVEKLWRHLNEKIDPGIELYVIPRKRNLGITESIKRNPVGGEWGDFWRIALKLPILVDAGGGKWSVKGNCNKKKCDEYKIIGSGGKQADKIEELVSKITNNTYVDRLPDNKLSEDIQKVLQDDLETQNIDSSFSLPREIGTAKDVNNILLASNWKEIVNNLLPEIEKAYGVVKYKKDDAFINRDNTVKITINELHSREYSIGFEFLDFKDSEIKISDTKLHLLLENPEWSRYNSETLNKYTYTPQLTSLKANIDGEEYRMFVSSKIILEVYKKDNYQICTELNILDIELFPDKSIQLKYNYFDYSDTNVYNFTITSVEDSKLQDIYYKMLYYAHENMLLDDKHFININNRQHITFLSKKDIDINYSLNDYFTNKQNKQIICTNYYIEYLIRNHFLIESKQERMIYIKNHHAISGSPNTLYGGKLHIATRDFKFQYIFTFYLIDNYHLVFYDTSSIRGNVLEIDNILLYRMIVMGAEVLDSEHELVKGFGIKVFYAGGDDDYVVLSANTEIERDNWFKHLNNAPGIRVATEIEHRLEGRDMRRKFSTEVIEQLKQMGSSEVVDRQDIIDVFYQLETDAKPKSTQEKEFIQKISEITEMDNAVDIINMGIQSSSVEINESIAEFITKLETDEFKKKTIEEQILIIKEKMVDTAKLIYTDHINTLDISKKEEILKILESGTQTKKNKIQSLIIEHSKAIDSGIKHRISRAISKIASE